MQRMLWRTLREDIEIRIALAPDLWPAFADPGQLESAILNLAINARDAMPNGGGLTISTANVAVDEHYRDRNPEVTPGNYVLIAVTDTGEGMPPEVLARAFEPFFTTKEVGKGSGLGLSMVYGFVKQSNGHVSIYSEVGLGTTVRLYLPAHSTMPADLTAAQAGAEGEPPRGRETVLVTEDDPFVRAYVVSALEDLGYRVIAAEDAREALTHADRRRRYRRAVHGHRHARRHERLGAGRAGAADQAGAETAVHLRLRAGDPGGARPHPSGHRHPQQALPPARTGPPPARGAELAASRGGLAARIRLNRRYPIA